MSNANKIKKSNRRVKLEKENKEYKEFATAQAVRMITSAMFISLHDSYGFGNKRLNVIMESIEVVLDEVKEDRLTIDGLYKWCKEMTGIDVSSMFKD